MIRSSANLVELGEDRCQRYRDRPLFGTKGTGGWVWTTSSTVSTSVGSPTT